MAYTSIEDLSRSEQKFARKELEKISQIIKLKRDEKGITQEQLAESLDISVSMLALIETTSRVPSIPLLMRIFKKLGVKTTFS